MQEVIARGGKVIVNHKSMNSQIISENIRFNFRNTKIRG